MPWLIVVGEAEALTWILANKRMAFRSYVRTGALAEGQRFAFYVTRGAFHNPSRDEGQIGGVGRIATDLEAKPVTVMGEEFDRSVGLDIAATTPPRQGLPFKPLIPKLDFIVKKDGWAAYLRQTLVQVSDKDFNLISEAFQRHLAKGAATSSR